MFRDLFLIFSISASILWQFGSFQESTPERDKPYVLTRPVVPNINVWAETLDELERDIKALATTVPDPVRSRTVQMILIPVDAAKELKISNEDLRRSMSSDLNPGHDEIDLFFKSIEKKHAVEFFYDQNEAAWTGWIVHSSPRSELLTRARTLFRILQEAYAARNNFRCQTQKHQDKLDRINSQISYACALLYSFKQEAKDFGWSDAESVSRAYISSYYLSQKTREDSQSLRNTLDAMRMQLQVIEAAIRQLDRLVSDLQEARKLSDTQIEMFEQEYVFLGSRVKQMTDRYFELPELT
ncbi:hypothetical protein ACJ41O_012300 [Fusarium nematophilum]